MTARTHRSTSPRGNTVVPAPRRRARAGAPGGLDAPRIGRLVGPDPQRHHRHAEAERLQRRVPAAVGDEAAHGRVRQHVQLRAPAHDHRGTRRRGLVQEAARELVLLGGPHHPKERRAGGEEAAGELLRLGGAEGREAAEGDVGHGARGLGVQPLDAGVLRVQQVGAVGDPDGARGLGVQPLKFLFTDAKIFYQFFSILNAKKKFKISQFLLSQIFVSNFFSSKFFLSPKFLLQKISKIGKREKSY